MWVKFILNWIHLQMWIFENEFENELIIQKPDSWIELKLGNSFFRFIELSLTQFIWVESATLCIQDVFLMMVKNLKDDRGPLNKQLLSWAFFLFQPSEGDRGKNRQY